jgi:hypothetical protein
MCLLTVSYTVLCVQLDQKQVYQGRDRMRGWRFLYWLLVGLAIGAGFVSFDVYFIALAFILIGLALLILGIVRFRGSEFWALLVGLGGFPTFIIVFDIVTASPPCTGNTLTIPPGATSTSCSSTLQNYYVFAIVFAAITLVGVGGLLLGRRRRQH